MNVRLLAAGLVAGLAVSAAQADVTQAPQPIPLDGKTSGVLLPVNPTDQMHRSLSQDTGEVFMPRGSTTFYTSNAIVALFNINAAIPNAGIPGDPNRICYDDVAIPSTRLGATGTTSLTVNTTILNVCQVTIGIYQFANAPATDVTAFFTTATNNPVAPDTAVDAPGVQIAAPVHIAANGATAGVRTAVFGNGVNTLFSVPLNFGFEQAASGAAASMGTFMIGVKLSDISNSATGGINQGWLLTTGPDVGADVFWVYDVMHATQTNDEGAFFFGAHPANPVANFYVILKGTAVAPATPAACCLSAANGSLACVLANSAAHCTQQGGVLGGSTSCTPSPCVPPANDLCSAAVQLNLNGTPVTGQNNNATVKALPGCGFNLVDGPAVFYKFTGNGNDVTVSTCNAGSTLDTVVHVFCSDNGCTGPLNCVGSNDDANPACGTNANASTLTVPTINGSQYYVVVNGFQGATGSFVISAMDTAAPSTVTTTCAARARCVLDNDPFDFAESDACGAGAGLDNNNSCATATVYPALGQIAKGTISTTGTFRDIDMFQLPAAAAGQTVTVAINCESPCLVQFQNDPAGDCAAPAVIANSTFNIASCVGLNAILFQVALPASGNNYFLITTPSFNGDPCGTAPNSQNDYRVRIDVAQLGACCVAGFPCASQTLVDCADGGGDTWFAGLSCSLGAGGIDPCSVTPGRCCTNAGACTFVPSATTPQGSDCTAAGGTFTADPNATCTPNPCAAAGICCRGSTCNTTVATAAACTASLIPGQLAGATFSAGTTCNSGPVSSSPCCFANYNKTNGITVQDIFDFLADWFAGSRYANTGGNGNAATLSVQNIFDFLTDWFNGGCS